MMHYLHIISGILLLTAFIISEILFYTKFLPARRYARVSIVIFIIINIIIVLVNRYLMLPARIYLSATFLFALLGFALIFRVNFFTILYLSGHLVFFMFVFRAIVLASFSLILRENIQSVIENNAYYPWAFCISLVGAYIFLKIIRHKLVYDEDMRQLFQNRNQFLTFISIFQIFFNLFLLVIHNAYAYSSAVEWFSFAHLMTSVFTLFVLELTLFYTVKINRMLEYEVYTRQLQEQLKRQLQHYKSYQKYTESFRAFKHDYKDMMVSVKSLLKKNDIEKAKKLIDDTHDELQRNVLVHQSYSNNLLLDAILQDIANQCEDNGIRFSFVAFLPDSIKISDLNISRIFSNLTHNAVEACLKVPVAERFIEIKSSKSNDWITIEIINSFNGQINIKNGELESTKPNKEMHGLGTKAVKEIIEGLGGMVFFEKMDHNIFSIKLHIPNITHSIH